MKDQQANMARPEPISGQQLKTIGMARRELGLTDDIYYDRIWLMFEKSSAKELSRTEATILIESFIQDGYKIQPRRPRPSDTPASKPARMGGNVTRLYPSEGQARKIGRLKSLIQWIKRDGYDAWLRKRFGMEAVRTSADAHKVIEGLKGVYARQLKRKYGVGWRDMRTPEIEDFIRWGG